MNLNQQFGCGHGRKLVSSASRGSSRRLRGHLERIRRSVLREYAETLGGHQQLLRLALNEAEALACQTPFPHLFFPTLAQEKVVAVSRWAARQRVVQDSSATLQLAFAE